MAIDGDYLLETLKRSIGINSIIPHEEPYAAFLADEIRRLGLELVDSCVNYFQGK